jgi:hypothetical protein
VRNQQQKAEVKRLKEREAKKRKREWEERHLANPSNKLKGRAPHKPSPSPERNES